MQIKVVGRNVSVSDKLRNYSEEKFSRLEKFFHQVIDTRVIVFTEKLDHVVEVVLNGDGVQFHGSDKAGDFYSAIDLLSDKLEQQVKRFKEKHQLHKGIPASEMPIVDIFAEDNLFVEMKEVSPKPIDEVEAFLRMRLDNADYILFKKGVPVLESAVDFANKYYSVLYKDGASLKLVEVPIENIRKNDFSAIVSYEVKVIQDSPTNPVIECNKCSGSEVKSMNIADAVNTLVESEKRFIPFLNTETNLFNVLFKKGKSMGVSVPAK